MIRTTSSIKYDRGRFIQTTIISPETEEEYQKVRESIKGMPDTTAPVIYEAKIPLQPRTKKNNQEIKFKAGKNGFYKKTKYGLKYVGIPFISQNKRYKQYEIDAGWFLKKLPEPIKGPVNVKCTFYRDSRRRCDLTNLLEAIDDILVKYGILADDNFEVLAGHDGSRVLVDKDNPRTEIEITQITE